MKIDILTLFPEMFDGFLEHSIIGRAQQGSELDLKLIQWRDYTDNKHNKVDDAPYGGGAGMVLQCQPVFDAIEDLKPADASMPQTQVIYLSPQGELLTQTIANDLAQNAKHLILICGHYEGLDQRAIDSLVDREISIGDYVITGGELAAATLTDAVVRLLPSVLGNEESAPNDSHMDGVFDHPHYTRPEVFRDLPVPRILLDGHHEKQRVWRRKKALKRTLQVRPDLIEKAPLNKEDKQLLQEIRNEAKA